MISEFCKSYYQCGPRHESYEEKYERQQAKRESLCRRNNTTMCRLMNKHHSKEAKELLQSPRQMEFLRRRNLISSEIRRKEVRLSPGTDTSVFLEDQTSALEGMSVWPYLRSPPSNQVSWNNPNSQLHQKSQQHGFSDAFAHGKLSSLLENKFTVKVSKNGKGTQTTSESSTEKKNSSQQTEEVFETGQKEETERSCGIAVLDKEIVQLSNYLNEALYRELLLKQKMVILQKLLATLLQAAEKSWKGQLNEDKLRCRMSVLENQLQTCTQSYSKRSLKRILLEMEDQKHDYEQKAKDSLQKLLEEKVHVEGQLQNAKSALAVAEEDCIIWKEHYNILKKDWSQLTDKHVELENKLHVLENKLQWSDSQNSQLHQALQNLENERSDLYSRIDVLQEDNRITLEFLSAIEGKLKTEERQKLMLEATIKHLHNVMQNQSRESKAQQDEMQKTDQTVPMHSPARTKETALSKDHKGGRERGLEDQLQERTSQFTAKEKECTALHHELELLSDEYHSCLTKLHQCRDELNHSQSKQVKRQQDHWIPLLMVVMATAMVSYLANFIP